MNDKSQSVHTFYRAEAIKQFTQSQNESAYPKYISVRVFPFIWGFVGLLLICVGLTWFVHIPVYANGEAVVISKEPSPPTQLSLIILVPTDHLDAIESGQSFFVTSAFDYIPTQSTIETVTKTPMSPSQISTTYNVDARIVTTPKIVATAPWLSSNNSFDADTYIGTRFPVRVQIGTRRLASFLQF